MPQDEKGNKTNIQQPREKDFKSNCLFNIFIPTQYCIRATRLRRLLHCNNNNSETQRERDLNNKKNKKNRLYDPQYLISNINIPRPFELESYSYYSIFHRFRLFIFICFVSLAILLMVWFFVVSAVSFFVFLFFVVVAVIFFFLSVCLSLLLGRFWRVFLCCCSFSFMKNGLHC